MAGIKCCRSFHEFIKCKCCLFSEGDQSQVATKAEIERQGLEIWIRVKREHKNCKTGLKSEAQLSRKLSHFWVTFYLRFVYACKKSSSESLFALPRFEYSYSLYEIAFHAQKKLLPSIPTPAQLLSTEPEHKKQQESARNEKSFGEKRERIRIDLDREPLKYNGNGKSEGENENIVGVSRFACFGWKYFPTTISLD